MNVIVKTDYLVEVKKDKGIRWINVKVQLKEHQLDVFQEICSAILLINELRQIISNIKANLIPVTRSDSGKCILIITHSHFF